VPRAVLFVLDSGVVDAARASPLGELFLPGKLVNQNAGAGSNLVKGHYTKAGKKLLLNPFSVAAFVVNSSLGACVFGARACSLCS